MNQKKFQEKVRGILSGVKAIKRNKEYIVEGRKLQFLGLPLRIIYKNPKRLLGELEGIIKKNK